MEGVLPLVAAALPEYRDASWFKEGNRAPGTFFAAVDDVEDEPLVVEVIVGGVGTAAGAGAASVELELIVVTARGAVPRHQIKPIAVIIPCFYQ